MRNMIVRILLRLLGWIGIMDYVIEKFGMDDTVKTGEMIVYVIKKEK